MVKRLDSDTTTATQRVYLGILDDLERRRMAAGQRLVETDLADRFGVGRNAVREAMQRLSVRGVVNLIRNRSPAIRHLDTDEVMEVLEVAAALTALMLGAAARAFNPNRHTAKLEAAIAALSNEDALREPSGFSRARRAFYRVIISIGGNRELARLFPAIGMHIIYSQFQSPRLQHLRIADYRAMGDAVAARDDEAAEKAARRHVAEVRVIIEDMINEQIRRLVSYDDGIRSVTPNSSVRPSKTGRRTRPG